MRTSEKGIAFIKSAEGFAAKVYNDVGKQAIGYGHDLLPGESFIQISPDQADQLLRQDLAARYEPAVNALVPADCTQGQFDACVDFCFNLGPSAFKMMVGHGWKQVPEQILRWDHVGGQVNAGLTARRKAEASMFTS